MAPIWKLHRTAASCLENRLHDSCLCQEFAKLTQLLSVYIHKPRYRFRRSAFSNSSSFKTLLSQNLYNSRFKNALIITLAYLFSLQQKQKPSCSRSFYFLAVAAAEVSITTSTYVRGCSSSWFDVASFHSCIQSEA